MAGIFQVLWGQPGGGFKQPTPLQGTDGKPLIILPDDKKTPTLARICTRPTAADWDGDGHIDLVVGNFGGSFYLFKGEGKGKFAPKATKLTSGGKALEVRHHSDPFVIDWDADGDLDLLSGASGGGVHWAENTAGKGKAPTLKPFKAIIASGPKREYGAMLKEADLDGPGSDTRIWVDDINGDGKLDLLVGDSVQLVSPAKGLTEKEYHKQKAAWKVEKDKCIAILSNRKSKKAEKRAAGKKMNNLHNQRKDFEITKSTGYVWLYLQK